MANVLITGGWLVDILCLLWIGLILLERIWSWIPAQEKAPGRGFHYGVSWAANLPVNLVRRTLPTVYRDVDFAPWLTILLLVLMKTFIFRAVIYWGMLHRPVG